MKVFLTLLDRSGLIEANHCGDGAGNKSSGRAYKCATDAMPGGDPGAPSTDDLPFESACLCQLNSARSRPGFVSYFAFLFLCASVLRRSRRSRL